MVNLQDIMKKFQEVQSEVSRIQDSLRHKTVTGEAGAGMVRVIANGAQEILKIEIEEHLIVPSDKAMMQDMIVAAVNNALKASRDLAEQEMRQVQSLIPKIPGLPF